MEDKIIEQLSNHDEERHLGDAVYASKKQQKSSLKIGDIVQVIDNSSGRIFVQGTISCEKKFAGDKHKLDDDKRFISVDNRFFFKLDDNVYSVIKLKSSYVDEAFLSDNYRVFPWNRFDSVKRDEVDFFREYSIDELDKEVVNVVFTLNDFSPFMQTTGSCSGHGKEPAWVAINFNDSRALYEFHNVLDPFTSKIKLTTQECTTSRPPSYPNKTFVNRPVSLRLVTKEIGKPAWQALDEFAEYLSTIIDARSRFWNLENKLINRESDRLTTDGK